MEVPWGQRWMLCLQIALGLQAIHKAGIVHHDLRAANVMVGPAGQRCAKITDFGLSRVRQEVTKQTKSTSSGNVRWLAPEYLLGGEYTPACDVFSFAMVMWEGELDLGLCLMT